MRHLLLLVCFMSASALKAQSGIDSSKPNEASSMPKTENIKNQYLDIAYASASPTQKLDIYLPNTIKGPLPVIIAVHGGAFMYGDKADEQLTPMLQCIPKGYAVVSINYRLSGEALFPANINDVKAAVRWVKANAAQYHFNPDKIALWGSSAGGNLVALAGTSAGVAGLEDLSLGNEQYSSKVQAVVDWYGPTNFLLMDEQLRATGVGEANHSEANSPESLVLGKKITEIPDLVQKANPETYISKDDPPFFIAHGTKDPIVPMQQSHKFSTQLKAVLGDERVTLVLLQDAAHGGPQFESKELMEKVFAFLDKQLK